ncbi:MAG: hypothetical protein HPAVJP_3010 [Candidatus Hepatoplasma vulgare]|nr:MAG: hypothetical protein HPAVJP_3010 [Candidatus Hepatoplasma sp.]
MKIIKKQINDKPILESKKKCNEKCISNKEKLITGKYISLPLGLLENTKIRPKLVKIINFDEKYIKTKLNPNKFEILEFGKLFFKISLKNVLNDEFKKTLDFNIYVNGKLAETTEKIIEANFKGDITIISNLEIKKEENIYFEYFLRKGKGSLNLRNIINYEIKFFEKNIFETSSKKRNDNIKENNEIKYLLSRVENNQNQILDLKKKILNLKSKITETEFSIGSVILGKTKPNYGIWEDWGVLADGQTIIGGKTSKGSIIKHNHQWISQYAIIGNSNEQDNIAFSGFNTYDLKGNQFWLGKNEGTIVNQISYTSLFGSENNYAYGFGLGSDIHVFKRVD